MRISLHLRTAALAAGLCAVLAAAGAALWANQTGLPDEWRRMIEAELSRHGTHARIGSLRYVPLEGIVAGDVELFSPEDGGRRLAHIQQVVLGLNLSELVRGKVRLERLELSDARVALPTVEGSPDLVIEHLTGRVLMNAGNVIEVREARGMIGGVALDFGARLIGNATRTGGAGGEVGQLAARRLLLARVVKELERWDFDAENPPRIRLFVEGELDTPEDLQVSVALETTRLGTAGYQLKNVRLAGEIIGGVLSLDSVHARDRVGSLDGRIEYDVKSRSGRFSGSSSLDALRLLHAFFGIRAMEGFRFENPPKIDIDATFRLPPGEAPKWAVVGHGESGAFSFGGNSFLGVKASFSANGKDVYLRDVELRHSEGTARGKVLVHDGQVRYHVKTDVPVDPWRPFFAGKPLQKLLDEIQALPGHSVAVDLDGTNDLHDERSWSCVGSIHTTGVRYRGVPLREFRSRVWLNEDEFRFDEVSAVFDDTRYPLKQTRSKEDPYARADNVTIDRAREMVRVENLTGTCWPGQVADMFNRKLGKNLARYRFHAPPTVRAAGKIDMKKGGNRTDFRTDFEAPAGADYRFLGRDVPLEAPTGRVRVIGDQVKIENLNLVAFGGHVDGDLVVTAGHALDGEFHWQRVSLPEIADCYRFGPVKAGKLTGRLKFTGSTAGLADLAGDGVLVLEDGELFEVPIFGPLSSLMNGVLGTGLGFGKKNKEKIGFQLAREASCTFTIRDGVLATGDFHTETPSFTITGEGSVDLDAMTLDMTVRLDARGLYGVITLPLRPLYGLFQFSGTGPLKHPEWRNVMFTAPKNDIPEPSTPLRARPVLQKHTTQPRRPQKSNPENIPKAHPVSPAQPSPPARPRRIFPRLFRKP